jgi:signal transduction histidine kinase
MMQHIATDISKEVGDPARVAADLEHLHRELRIMISVSDPDGELIASEPPGVIIRCDEHAHDGHPHAPCFVEPIAFPDGRVGRLVIRAPDPPPPFGFHVIAIVLVVVGVSSWLLARSLTRPLRRLSSAARSFGEGDLEARAGVVQRDELGDVGRAFDTMAERVTELLRAERELLANVSHELRTPLARIRMAFGLIEDGDAAAARASIADVTEDLDELERLLSDILTAARLELGDARAGTPPLRKEQVDVADLVERAAAKFRSSHPERALSVEVAKDLVTIDADPMMLRRVVDNLLENAHKYSPDPSSTITLRALRAPGGAAFEVADQGMGIPEDDLPHLFTPFFRGERSRARGTGGVGLGLTLARRIVEAHRGSIEVTSAVGAGTTFRVLVPASPS